MEFSNLRCLHLLYIYLHLKWYSYRGKMSVIRAALVFLAGYGHHITLTPPQSANVSEEDQVFQRKELMLTSISLRSSKVCSYLTSSEDRFQWPLMLDLHLVRRCDRCSRTPVNLLKLTPIFLNYTRASTHFPEPFRFFKYNSAPVLGYLSWIPSMYDKHTLWLRNPRSMLPHPRPFLHLHPHHA